MEFGTKSACLIQVSEIYVQGIILGVKSKLTNAPFDNLIIVIMLQSPCNFLCYTKITSQVIIVSVI